MIPPILLIVGVYAVRRLVDITKVTNHDVGRYVGPPHTVGVKAVRSSCIVSCLLQRALVLPKLNSCVLSLREEGAV